MTEVGYEHLIQHPRAKHYGKASKYIITKLFFALKVHYHPPHSVDNVHCVSSLVRFYSKSCFSFHSSNYLIHSSPFHSNFEVLFISAMETMNS